MNSEPKTRTCRTCKRRKKIEDFYEFESHGYRYHRHQCKQCEVAAKRRERMEKRLRGEYWFQEASGGKRPNEWGFTYRFGTKWLKYKKAYECALRDLASICREQKNPKAVRIINDHIRNFPRHVPYEMRVEGYEWPLISHALRSAYQHGKGVEYRRMVQNLYQRLSKQNTEAKYDHEFS